MTPFFSSVSHDSPKQLLMASLLLCPGLAMAAAFTPLSHTALLNRPVSEAPALEGLVAGALAGISAGDRWCLLHRSQSSLQILQGHACDSPQIGLVRQFD